MGVGLVTASERIYLGVKLLKDVYNQFECEIRSHSVLELTINKNSTHFMSLFALFALRKSVNKSANIRTIRSHPLLKCEQLFALQFCARMETLVFTKRRIVSVNIIFSKENVMSQDRFV